MHRFEVWVPGKDAVEVVVDGRRVPMTRRQHGWWEALVANAAAGSRYGFSIDGGEVRPDPRSPSQPDGVLGLSELVDHSAYAWRDSAWRGLSPADLVIYELHIGTFSPATTFDGVIERIPYLVDLGVSAVEVMPVAEFSGDRGWGYDGVDLFAPHHAYGGPEGLQRLVDACHVAGLGVVLDVVYNHLGPLGNFLAEFGPYFSDRNHTSWGAAINFDGPDSAEVRRFVVDNALMWTRDYHIDGLRLDAVHAIFDDSPRHILEQIATEVKALASELGKSVLVIAETNQHDPRIVQSRDRGGFGLDAVWTDDWHHALHTVLTGERSGYYKPFGSFDQLGTALRQAWVQGGSVAEMSNQNLVVSAQNHDQVGNRANGDRLGGLVSEGRLRIASALLLSSQFTPLLFQGEEWAASSPFLYFTDHADPSLGRAVSEGRRREFAAFGWDPAGIPDPQDAATFERSQLHWDEVDRPPHRDFLDWYRRLLALRRSLPMSMGRVGDGVMVEIDCERRRLVFKRDPIAVYVNLGEENWHIQPAGSLVMHSHRSAAGVVPPDGVTIFTKHV